VKSSRIRKEEREKCFSPVLVRGTLSSWIRSYASQKQVGRHGGRKRHDEKNAALSEGLTRQKLKRFRLGGRARTTEQASPGFRARLRWGGKDLGSGRCDSKPESPSRFKHSRKLPYPDADRSRNRDGIIWESKQQSRDR